MRRILRSVLSASARLIRTLAGAVWAYVLRPIWRVARDIGAEARFRIRVVSREGPALWLMAAGPVLTFSWIQALHGGAFVPAPGCSVALLRKQVANGDEFIRFVNGVPIRPCWRTFYVYGTATTLALAVGLAAMLYLSARLSHARESGELLRVRSSPMSLRVYFAGHLAGATFALLFMGLIVTFVAEARFGIPLEMPLLVAALPILGLGLLAFSSIGLLTAAVSRTPTFALGFAFTVLFGMVAASSVFHSPHLMPTQMYEAASWFPLQALSTAIYTVIEPDVNGSRLAREPIARLAGWAAAGLPLWFWFPTMRSDR